ACYVCVVGDDDQSIYGFRGAEVRNILGFEEIFPNTGIIKLERNYRSYQSILDVAQAVVERNESRLGKELKAERKGGQKPVLAVLANQDEETAYCARIIDAQLRKGRSFSDVAILYRTNAQSLAFERAFPPMGIPYRLVGALRFYEREEVKDALALLALASNARDEVAFRRIINKPSRGIGEASLELLVSAALSSDGNLLDAAEHAELKTQKARNGLAAFSRIMHALVAKLGPASEPGQTDTEISAPSSRELSLAPVLEWAVQESGLLAYHRDQDEIAGSQKTANLDELQNAAADWPATRSGLSAFLEAVELDRAMSQADASADAVTLITMHNTKGLEFPVVIATGMEQGLFPRDNEEGEQLEEQRRLFYVAMTRAKDELYLTYCRRRLFRGRTMDYPPSRFLAEIPPKKLETFGGKLDLSAVSAMGSWKSGVRVYHDDHGYGHVIKVSPAGDSGVCVMVRFETGSVLQFFPSYTKKLEIIKD
ncbi:MAG TPA: 3'-5' exonuclease, partial [Spirochaetales bacterium]|nr:3'-5' exonuclease [Spirochaetales bacterium]